jgi:hypothetical protein
MNQARADKLAKIQQQLIDLRAEEQKDYESSDWSDEKNDQSINFQSVLYDAIGVLDDVEEYEEIEEIEEENEEFEEEI